MIGVVSVAVAVIPWVAIPLVALGIIFFVLRGYFLETSRDIKRLESTSEYQGLRAGMVKQVRFHPRDAAGHSWNSADCIPACITK